MRYDAALGHGSSCRALLSAGGQEFGLCCPYSALHLVFECIFCVICSVVPVTSEVRYYSHLSHNISEGIVCFLNFLFK